MHVSRTVTAMIVAALSAGCADNFAADEEETSAARSAEALCGEATGIKVSDPWIRSSRAGQPTSAAYLTLTNCSKQDDALIAVSFEGAAAAELHTTNMSSEGVASMKQSKTVAIAAGDSLILEPGAGHIMLVGMADAIAQGANPAMALEFHNGTALEVVFDVRDAMQGEDHSAH